MKNKKNKKGLFRVMSLILIFSFISLVMIFSVIFIKEIGKEQMLDKLDNYTYQVEDEFGLSLEMKEHIHSLPEEYDETNPMYDLFFLIGLITTFVITMVSSFKSAELGMFSFLGYLTLGVAGFLFVSSFFMIINDWFIFNFIQGFLEFDFDTVPMINYYINNLSIINFIWAILIVGVNKISFVLIRNKKDEEDFIYGGGFEE
jgi:hypothetical protein